MDGEFLRAFFKVGETPMPDLYRSIVTVFDQSKEKVVPSLSVDPKMQPLIGFIFAKKMGVTGKELGTKVQNIAGNQNLPGVFRDTAQYYFYKDYDLFK